MKELPCWTIMNCVNLTCAARKSQAKTCWEIAQESEDHRAEFNICRDCLVYVLKTESLPFSPHDLDRMARDRSCPPACPLSTSLGSHSRPGKRLGASPYR